MMCTLKRVFIIILACLISLITGCTSSNTYRYADNFDEKSYQIEYLEPESAEAIFNIEYDSILEDCKSMILATDLKAKFPYLNWNNLENVEIRRCNGHLIDGQVQNIGIDARYHQPLNMVYVYPACDQYDADYVKTIVIHELIHCITYSEAVCTNQLWEGLADLYTMKICREFDLPFKLQYQMEFLSLTFFNNVFGEEAVVEMLYNGTLDSEIDRHTKPGMAAKFNCATSIAGHYYEMYGAYDVAYFELIKVIQDIQCHVAISACADMSEDTRKKVYEKCKTTLIYDQYIDESYFRKLLE